MEDLALEWLSLEAGSFQMGTDPSEDPEAEYEEGPIRRVHLEAFEISKTPVTVSDWDRFLLSTNYSWGLYSQLREASPTARHPATYVSWLDAKAFVDWLSVETDDEIALPTEAQWERACRGTDGRLYPWGNTKGGWLHESLSIERNEVVGNIHRVSGCGCLDMWMNVAEWCDDWFDDDEDRDDIARDQDSPTGPPSGDFKVFRGGSPADKGWPRCTYRGFQRPDFRHARLGFRCVRLKNR